MCEGGAIQRQSSWFVWSISFIWFVSFPDQMNQTNEINERNQMRPTDPAPRHAPGNGAGYSFSVYRFRPRCKIRKLTLVFYSGFLGNYGQTVTRKKVAGMEVVSLRGLLFWLLNRTSSSFCKSPARPFFSAASNAFMVGP